MSSQNWSVLYSMLREANKQVPRIGRRKQFSDVQIVAMYMWAVLHDRPQGWAIKRENYSKQFRPRRLPSRSQFNRRIKSLRCQALLDAMDRRLTESAVTGALMMDGRVLRVGPHSQDADATSGWGGGGFAKGYKLHVIASENNLILAWRVLPLNICEKTVAVELIQQMRPSGLLLADGYYDAAHLYDLVNTYGGQLLTRLPVNAGGGHRRKSPARMAAVRMWTSGEAKVLYRRRDGVERIFSQQSSFGGGLAPLPSWVRRLERVRRWVGVKTLIHNTRVHLRGKSVA